MAGYKPPPRIKERTARSWATPSRLLWLFPLLAILFSLPAAWAAQGHPTKGRQTKAPPTRAISFDYSITADGQNELLIQGDAPIKNHKSFLLTNPSRLVLDIPGVTLHGNTVELPVNRPELSRIRIARHPGKVRFVFDLTEEKNVRHTVTEQNNGLKVMLSLAEDEAAPQSAAAVADTQEPAEIQPSPAPDSQFQTLAPSDLETVFGSQRVSIIFNKTPIRDFAKYLSEKSGRRIEVSPELATSVSLRFTEVPLHALATAAADTIGFALQQDGERIVLHPASQHPQADGQKNGEASQETSPL
jgi:hypothetical protein